MRQTTPTMTMTAETPIATFFPATLFSKSRARERAAQHATATAAWKTLRKFCKFSPHRSAGTHRSSWYFLRDQRRAPATVQLGFVPLSSDGCAKFSAGRPPPSTAPKLTQYDRPQRWLDRSDLEREARMLGVFRKGVERRRKLR